MDSSSDSDISSVDYNSLYESSEEIEEELSGEDGSEEEDNETEVIEENIVVRDEYNELLRIPPIIFNDSLSQNQPIIPLLNIIENISLPNIINSTTRRLHTTEQRRINSSQNIENQELPRLSTRFGSFAPQLNSIDDFINSLLLNRIENNIVTNVLNESFRDSQNQTLKKNDKITVLIRPLSNKDSKDEIKCRICLNNFKYDKDKIGITECGHIFHINCITEWGKYKAECPLCREVLPYKEL